MFSDTEVDLLLEEAIKAGRLEEVMAYLDKKFDEIFGKDMATKTGRDILRKVIANDLNNKNEFIVMLSKRAIKRLNDMDMIN